MVKRYTAGARLYDVLSGEHLVYRAGRVAGIDALRLQRGDIVLDLGCGTGLNLPLLLERVGTEGHVIGLDRSSSMLAVASDRVRSHGWSNVSLLEADALLLNPAQITSIALREGGRSRFDAAFSSYAMSVFDDWMPAWALIRAVVRPGGRAGIVDMALPTGAAAVFAPLARLACAAGGADITARPWQALEREAADAEHTVLRGGHIHAVTGTLP
ncbi:MAG: methyltransferase domain-containing protein [Microbacteriaceae bacterium]|nr:methyltransferase domain-containing protein [Microbacteriaceae bacterium]